MAKKKKIIILIGAINKSILIILIIKIKKTNLHILYHRAATIHTTEIQLPTGRTKFLHIVLANIWAKCIGAGNYDQYRGR